MRLSSIIKFLACSTLLMTCHSYATQYKLLPDDGKATDHFGFSVAIDGTTALIGAYKADAKNVPDSGAAYVYSLGSAGWEQQAKLVAEPAHADDTLGGNVALKNHMAMLGVRNRDDKGADAGAVFAFERKANSWSQTQILTAIDAKPGDAFGQSIALTERFLVIGAPHSDSPDKDTGSAYVYIRDKNTWQFQGKLTAKDGAAGDLFGISVAIDGDTILVGADLNDEKAENAGAVYVFVFDGKQWGQQAKLMAEDGANTDIFGVRVALLGDTALISARRDDIEDVGVDVGSAYIFERIKNKWIQTQKLVAPDGETDDRFGRGVALNNEIALITAMQDDTNGTDTGALYVFKKQQGQWQLISKVVASDGAIEDRFGWNVALSGKNAIVASPLRDDNGNASGAAYIQNLSD
ncbi:MAG: FG-GAP repeat protein [Aestuariibacter sp.]